VLTIPHKLFADDCKLIFIYDDHNDQLVFQNNINLVYKWTQDWLLFLNEGKCKILRFRSKSNNTNYAYYINNHVIQETNIEKDLGILISNDLSWDNHINKICNNAICASKYVYKCFKYKNLETIRKLYIALIRPKLEYAQVIWSPTAIGTIKQLEKVQRKCTKVGPLAHLPYSTRLEKLKLTTLEERRIRGDLIQMFKIIKGFDEVQFVNGIEFYKTKARGHGLKYQKVTYKNSFRHNILYNRIATVWNGLPEDVVEAKNINDFKNKLDNTNIVYNVYRNKKVA
jgi:hypothetical protein